jgi:hypothetical protein
LNQLKSGDNGVATVGGFHQPFQTSSINTNLDQQKNNVKPLQLNKRPRLGIPRKSYSITTNVNDPRRAINSNVSNSNSTTSIASTTTTTATNKTMNDESESIMNGHTQLAPGARSSQRFKPPASISNHNNNNNNNNNNDNGSNNFRRNRCNFYY